MALEGAAVLIWLIEREGRKAASLSQEALRIVIIPAGC